MKAIVRMLLIAILIRRRKSSSIRMPAFCLHHVSEQCVEREEDCNPGGVIKPNGDLMSSPGACEHNGKTYYTFGAQFSKDYSGLTVHRTVRVRGS